ncbi:Lipoprotein-releasing system transmembrane protein LolC [Ascidiaceihabitans donghaensis]|uniref:Lipoprotein-releasing system transmembrane protein LolC n=1 Tax=Ascidiaceihabitans donghaensis TaxID=1510460 RepID=A0A2R8BG31_9RHOB|nr:ABC transporter permease [Ascidiaceihabitans donghaensis]SPH22081.1 Lipoprotein-releasing system transmembrane protein LolC [Ascidiaceihabitans donghaensis]
MASTPKPFAPFEWMIAWRYLRARRAEGGVSVMTWISLIGITLAVFALIATLAVRAGFRAEFVGTILGANAHVTIYNAGEVTQTGQIDRNIANYSDMAARIGAVAGVTRVAPLVRGQVMASLRQDNSGLDVYGIAASDLASLPKVVNPETGRGDIARFDQGIAIGSGVARALNAGIGDRIKLISPNGVRTAFGTSPRINAYEVVYIFNSGSFDIDGSRAYLPLADAQEFFNKEGVATELEVMVQAPEDIATLVPAIVTAAGDRALPWTWQERAGGFMRAISMQDNALFILLAILVLIATMNIISGLIMLVKNKGRDIGVLRTMGLTEGQVLRIFFIVGASIGTMGTLFGLLLGVLFSVNIEGIYQLVDLFMGQARTSLEQQGFIFPTAKLELGDVVAAVALSLGLSFIITIFPARKAARMNPVEALRYE